MEKNIHFYFISGHTPMYVDDSWTNKDALNLKLNPFSPEKLFYDVGVDVIIGGHVHKYQRTWPIYNGTVLNGSYDQPYTNPKAPVHIITGSGGCYMGQSDQLPPLANASYFTAFSNYNFTYTVMDVINETHLMFQQKSGDKYNFIIDQFTIIKSKLTG